jgi:glycosyltransferase involved in cell wall biosynthesis
MTHTVSIIIPAYNEEACLPLCLKSIADQDWPKTHLEVIVIDNGSFDSTCDIARASGAIVLQDDTKNVSGLRNLGAGHARGDILAFVDADCVVSPDWVACAARYFEDDTVAAWGSAPKIPENATWVQNTWFIVRQKKTHVADVDWLESMNLFVAKKVFMKAGGFDESLETCEDVDFSYRVSAYGKIVSDPSIKVIHLGEAATMAEFFKKELWRGRSNFSGAFAHGISLKELPSLAVPVYFGIFLPACLIFLMFHFTAATGWMVLAAICFPILPALYQLRGKKTDLTQKLQLTVLLYLYFTARTMAVVFLKKHE